MIRAVLFDLDGTLLPLDIDEFFRVYISAIADAFSHIVEPEVFTPELLAATRAMMLNNDTKSTLSEVFWRQFSSRVGRDTNELMRVASGFYSTEFKRLGQGIVALPDAARAVDTAIVRGYEVVLATNPLFPVAAIEERMRWAGVYEKPWRLVTSYERMHYTKPNPKYYAEILQIVGCSAKECVMVGNDTRDDLVASTLGMRTFLVEGFSVLRPDGYRPTWEGTLSDLVRLIERRFGV